MLYYNYNGKIYEESSLIIGPDNRGLRYGDGLFETLKLKDGKICFQEEHFARLYQGMKILQFETLPHFTATEINRQITSLAKKNCHEQTARIRLNIVRGDGGLSDPENNYPNYIIQTSALANDYDQWNNNGLVIGIYTSARKSCDLFSNLKHNNYLPYVQAAIEAKNEGWNDSLILNTNGRICDSTIANLFIVKNGIIYTPPLSEGCVAGVMRGVILRTLFSKSWEVAEKELTIDSLMTADEVFLTNSLHNIRWVERLAETSYQNHVTRKIYDLISKTFS